MDFTQMDTQETDQLGLLENARQRIQAPFSQMRQHLLTIYNIVFVLGASAYLLSEKAATGHFFPDPFLGYMYGLVGLTNLISAVYHLYYGKNTLISRWFGIQITTQPQKRVKTVLRWSSVLAVMALSALFMLGIGNPSSDSLVGDFALGNLLIVLSAMILGRQVSIGWSIIVMGILIYISFFERGYSYQYNYLTPDESARYEADLARGLPAALNRQAILREHHLNPPSVSRYFNMWTIYIIVAGLTAYYFAGLAVKMFRIIPIVTRDITTYMEVANRQKLNQLTEKSKLEEDRLHVQREALSAELRNLRSQINPHFLY